MLWTGAASGAGVVIGAGGEVSLWATNGLSRRRGDKGDGFSRTGLTATGGGGGVGATNGASGGATGAGGAGVTIASFAGFGAAAGFTATYTIPDASSAPDAKAITIFPFMLVPLLG
ncbi:MAG TPA: hypothetical protein VMH80_13015 [Bryobacteraceae bacterium]|nr:hypothetical protein [Bryobacteraceae bacterium]